MVSRVRKGRHKQEVKPEKARRRVTRVVFEIGISLIILGIFLLKIVNYVDPEALASAVVGRTIARGADNLMSAVDNIPFFNHCPGELKMIDVSGGYVCVPDRSANDIYDTIYTSYPLVGEGRESIYSSTDTGSVSAAKDLLRGQVDLPRYLPVQFTSLPTWSENPYHAYYWRFEFYSLQPSLNLLYAYRATGETVYARQLLRLDLGFVYAESRSRWAWADAPTVAFRSLSLVDTWWKLRQGHQLPEAASTAILGELEKTGQFLADPNHYQPGESSAIDEAAALYELAVAFPTLPHAQQWLAVADQRFQWQLGQAIDASGQLIGNSPDSDFDALAKYWQVYEYSIAQGSPISGNFAARMTSMINFATYVLQPDSQLPLMGSSGEATVNDRGVFSEMAASNPAFRYVLTHGAQGSAPPKTSVYFPASALTVMRSGWGGGTAFADSTYLTYYAGKYRTADSDLDALDITLYGDGGDLLTGPGLYSYAPGPYRDYFQGTLSHNTVVVDGRSQNPGSGTAEPLATRDGLTYQSAESSLYGGVTHRRMVMMIDPDHVLVVDRLSSARVHTYQQMFHLFPGARLSKSGLTVSGTGGTPRREITIRQLLPGGLSERNTIDRKGRSPDGLCSKTQGRLLPCYAVSYSARGADATFLTLLTIGPLRRPGFGVTVDDGGRSLRIVDGRRDLTVSLGETTAVPPANGAAHHSPPRVTTTPVTSGLASGDWSVRGAGLLSGGTRDPASDAAVSLSAGGGASAVMQNDAIRLDLEHKNARLRLRVTGLTGVAELRLSLSNDHWASSVSTNLLSSYTSSDDGEWVDLFLGPSQEWGPGGGWQASAPGFNWAQIDGMDIEIVTRNAAGTAPAVSIGGLDLMPAQKQGTLVFMFDGGSASILPAASYLHQNGMAASVAVIGKYADYPADGYLNVAQLRQLQNGWGWNVVNETQQGADAVRQYYARRDLAGYAADIVHQAVWLEDNHLNSAPDWFVYPGGATNAALASVVGRFYKFAQVTADGPDAYPYGDPREITDLDVEYPGDGEGAHAPATSPAEILAAVRQAAAYHMTLILDFNRIDAEPGGLPGYPLALFRKVADGVRRSGIKVLTLSRLDARNGVPENDQVYASAGRPSQITVQIRS